VIERCPAISPALSTPISVGITLGFIIIALLWAIEFYRKRRGL